MLLFQGDKVIALPFYLTYFCIIRILFFFTKHIQLFYLEQNENSSLFNYLMNQVPNIPTYTHHVKRASVTHCFTSCRVQQL